MPKYNAEVVYPGQPGSLIIEGLHADSQDEAESEVRDNLSIEVENVGSLYDVRIELSFQFEYEDQEGDYEDEGDVQRAVENGDIDWRDFVEPTDADIGDVQVSEQ